VKAGIFEGRASALLPALLPKGTPVFVANSMPVRDLEYFCPANNRELVVHCNRGANGIDGFVSTVVGVAQAGDPGIAVGLCGASLLGAVVMPLSTSYAICEAFGWESGISKNFREAPVFMSLFTLLLVLGAVVVLIPGISLIPLIISAQIANGILLPIVLIFIVRLATDRHLMGDAVNGRVATILGWGVAAMAGSLSLAYLFVSVFAT